MSSNCGSKISREVVEKGLDLRVYIGIYCIVIHLKKSFCYSNVFFIDVYLFIIEFIIGGAVVLDFLVQYYLSHILISELVKNM